MHEPLVKDITPPFGTFDEGLVGAEAEPFANSLEAANWMRSAVFPLRFIGSKSPDFAITYKSEDVPFHKGGGGRSRASIAFNDDAGGRYHLLTNEYISSDQKPRRAGDREQHLHSMSISYTTNSAEPFTQEASRYETSSEERRAWKYDERVVWSRSHGENTVARTVLPSVGNAGVKEKGGSLDEAEATAAEADFMKLAASFRAALTSRLATVSPGDIESINRTANFANESNKGKVRKVLGKVGLGK